MDRILFYLAVLTLLTFVFFSKVFSPVWLILLAIFILWYQRNTKGVKPFLFTAIFLLIAYTTFLYFSILIPFIIGIGLAYIVAPVVDRLEKRKIPRILSILIVILPLIALIPSVLFLLVINLTTELRGLIEKIPELFDFGRQFITGVIQRLEGAGFAIDQEVLLKAINSYLGSLLNGIVHTISQIGQGLRGIFFFVYNFFLIPIVAYIILADREKIYKWIMNLIPKEEQNHFDLFIKKLNISFSLYFRGQIVLMILVGFITGFLLWLLGIRYYVFLGIMAGLCNLIPNVGYVISLIPALLIGILTPPFHISLFKILLVYVSEQMLENFLLGPLIIGKASRLNPAVVILALILGGGIGRFWGIIFAVPAVIFLREFLNQFFGLNL
uniref:AI-2E family transporter n=1 Tax=candidate division WOR-3 bacterium TaxID=2052148 RepID=A0A7V3VUK1_UNCW3